MKITTRKELLSRYHDNYPELIFDPEERVREYFKSNNMNLEKAINKATKKLNDIVQYREYKTVKITMCEYPMKTDRPRTFRGHTFSPNASANNDYFRKAIKQICKSVNLINTPATIIIDAYMEMPKQVPADEIILYEAKVLEVVDTPDYDNIGKCYTDILKNTLIVDDDIFHSGTINKYYSLLPRVELTITYQTTHDSDYVFKKLKTRKSIKELLANNQLTITKINEESRKT